MTLINFALTLLPDCVKYRTSAHGVGRNDCQWLRWRDKQSESSCTIAVTGRIQEVTTSSSSVTGHIQELKLFQAWAYVQYNHWQMSGKEKVGTCGTPSQLQELLFTNYQLVDGV